MTVPGIYAIGEMVLEGSDEPQSATGEPLATCWVSDEPEREWLSASEKYEEGGYFEGVWAHVRPLEDLPETGYLRWTDAEGRNRETPPMEP